MTKANVKRGQAVINLDKERVLFFNLNALCALEEMGVDIAHLGESVKMSQIRAILWAGLTHEDAALTIEEVGNLITMENLQEVSEAITAAFMSKGKK